MSYIISVKENIGYENRKNIFFFLYDLYHDLLNINTHKNQDYIHPHQDSHLTSPI